MTTPSTSTSAMEKPRILFFSPAPNLNVSSQSGYGTHMREIIHAFQSLGIDVEYFIAGTYSRDNESFGDLADGRALNSIARTIRRMAKTIIPAIVWESLKDCSLIMLDSANKYRLHHLISDFKPHIIYERSHYGMTAGARIAKQHGIYHILEINCPNTQERVSLGGPSLLSRFASNRDKVTIQRSDMVSVVSQTLADILEIPTLAKEPR